MAVLRDAPQPLAVALRLPAVIAAYHVAYGIGTIVGAFDVLRGRSGRERFATAEPMSDAPQRDALRTAPRPTRSAPATPAARRPTSAIASPTRRR